MGGDRSNNPSRYHLTCLVCEQASEILKVNFKEGKKFFKCLKVGGAMICACCSIAVCTPLCRDAFDVCPVPALRRHLMRGRRCPVWVLLPPHPPLMSRTMLLLLLLLLRAILPRISPRTSLKTSPTCSRASP